MYEIVRMNRWHWADANERDLISDFELNVEAARSKRYRILSWVYLFLVLHWCRSCVNVKVNKLINCRKSLNYNLVYTARTTVTKSYLALPEIGEQVNWSERKMFARIFFGLILLGLHQSFLCDEHTYGKFNYGRINVRQHQSIRSPSANACSVFQLTKCSLGRNCSTKQRCSRKTTPWYSSTSLRASRRI